MSRLGRLALLVGVALLAAAPGRAVTLFFEDFETGLDGWTGNGGGGYFATVVGDPLEVDSVLGFTGTNSAGDIFTAGTFFHPGGQYRYSFDYLSTSEGWTGGGFIGYSYGLPGPHDWVGGYAGYPSGSTGTGVVVPFPDTGVWEHIVIDFTAGAPFHIMLEDFVGPAGNAFFDNLRLEVVPEPGSVMLVAFGLVGLAAVRRRRR